MNTGRLAEYQRQVEELYPPRSPGEKRTILVLLEMCAEETGGPDVEEAVWLARLRHLLDEKFPEDL